MIAYGGGGSKATHTLITSDECEWSASCSGHFIPVRNHQYKLQRGLGCPTAILDVAALPGSKPHHPVHISCITD